GCERSGAAAKSRTAVPTDGGVRQRQPPGRGCRVPLGSARGVRTSVERRSEVLVPERDRHFARTACTRRSVVPAHRVWEGDDRDTGAGEAAFGRTGVRRELDRRYRSRATSPVLSSEESSTG